MTNAILLLIGSVVIGSAALAVAKVADRQSRYVFAVFGWFCALGFAAVGVIRFVKVIWTS